MSDTRITELIELLERGAGGLPWQELDPRALGLLAALGADARLPAANDDLAWRFSSREPILEGVIQRYLWWLSRLPELDEDQSRQLADVGAALSKICQWAGEDSSPIARRMASELASVRELRKEGS